MSHCPNETDWVLYAAGELDAARQSQLRDHLASCPACAAEAGRLARGLRALETLNRDLPMRAEAMDTLRRRLRAAAVTSKPTILSIFWRPRWAAAAAVLLAATLAVALWPTTPPVVGPVAKNTVKAPAKVPAYLTDTAIQEKLTEITATVEMLESSDNGKAAETPALTPASNDDDSDYEQFIEYMESGGDA